MTQNRRNKQTSKRRSMARAVLLNLHALRERRYVGDVGAIDTLLDFDTAIKHAKLTERQAEAIRLKYDVGLTQKEVARVMGVGQDVVSRHIGKAVAAIDEIYEAWAWVDGELSVEDFAEEV